MQQHAVIPTQQATDAASAPTTSTEIPKLAAPELWSAGTSVDVCIFVTVVTSTLPDGFPAQHNYVITESKQAAIHKVKSQAKEKICYFLVTEAKLAKTNPKQNKQNR